MMKSISGTFKSNWFILTLLFLQLVFFITTFLNVPIARQVFGFAFLAVVPGAVVTILMKLGKLDGLETLLYSVGLSIALLLFVGFLINEFAPIFGVYTPLSAVPLLIILNCVLLLLEFASTRRSENFRFSLEIKNVKEILVALFLIALPILSILGAVWVNSSGNSIFLLTMLIAISIIFIIGVVSDKILTRRLYPLALFSIAISLLFHSSLISEYIFPFGSDVPVEYAIFKNTSSNMYWSSANPFSGDLLYGRLNGMLSITVLPTTYTSLLNMQPTWVFKVLFPAIFSFVPLILYQTWQQYFGKKKAFIAAFLFMAQSTFYTELIGLNRQMIAEFFFVLLILVTLSKKVNPANKIILFALFSFGLVTSHYGLAEIFLFLIATTLFVLMVRKTISVKVTMSMIMLFFIVMFTWYLYISNSAVFESLLSFGDYIFGQIGDFFDPTSRGQGVLIGLGAGSTSTIWNTISRIFAYVTEGLIIVGFFALITKRFKAFIEKEYLILIFGAVGLLILLILVPGLANTLNITRFYHILLFFLAPLCIVGGHFLVQLISKQKQFLAPLLLVVVLVPYFLFQTGFVYEVVKSDSWAVPLSKGRMDPLRLYGHFGYMDARSVYGAQWLSTNVDVKQSLLYSDSPSRFNVLTSYGMIYRGIINELSNVTILGSNNTIYLSTLNTLEGIITSQTGQWNCNEFTFAFNDLNKIYSNGGSEIYKYPN